MVVHVVWNGAWRVVQIHADSLAVADGLAGWSGGLERTRLENWGKKDSGGEKDVEGPLEWALHVKPSMSHTRARKRGRQNDSSHGIHLGSFPEHPRAS